MNSTEMTPGARLLILATALLGWLFAGMNMAIVPLAARNVTIDLIAPADESLRSVTIGLIAPADESLLGVWFARFTCAFLLGAAVGGMLFGALGDRVGRAKAMGWAILCYTSFTGAAYFVTTPEQFLVLRFLACLGVGGIWPNGVALVSEAWPNVSRPLLSGLIGTAANLGLMLLSYLAIFFPITAHSWRWVMLVCASPAVLGLFVLAVVPESRLWQQRRLTRRGQSARDGASRHRNSLAEAGAQNPSPGAAALDAAGAATRSHRSAIAQVFRAPLLKWTLLGIVLGAVPLMGSWGSVNWLVPWAEVEGTPQLKAWTQWAKSSGAAIGSLLGGWLASWCGRRTAYFLCSITSLGTSSMIFWSLRPQDPWFLAWVSVIGFFGTIFFGWLPLYLPELFPTAVRATGSGVTFNFGRIATAIGVLQSGRLVSVFEGDYGRMGRITCLVYLIGAVAILFAPDTSRRRMDED